MKRGARLAVAAAIGATLWTPPAFGQPRELLTLELLESLRQVTVTLDTARFARERVATMTLKNPGRSVIRGAIPACRTIFVPADAAFSRLRPAESGPFLIGPEDTVKLSRLFVMIEPNKRPPGNTQYTLDDEALPEAGCKD